MPQILEPTIPPLELPSSVLLATQHRNVQVEFDAPDKPLALPSTRTIINLCRETRRRRVPDQHWSMIRGIPLYDQSDNTFICAWVKFGNHVTMAEARTQNYVAEFMRRDVDAPVRVPAVYMAFKADRVGYILMEYIEGELCKNADATLAAAAVKYLFDTVKPPLGQTPGPVGGGIICNDFFLDREADVEYPSVELLERHINKASHLQNVIFLLSI